MQSKAKQLRHTDKQIKIKVVFLILMDIFNQVLPSIYVGNPATSCIEFVLKK